jgi:hypothetical protein
MPKVKTMTSSFYTYTLPTPTFLIALPFDFIKA